VKEPVECVQIGLPVLPEPPTHGERMSDTAGEASSRPGPTPCWSWPVTAPREASSGLILFEAERAEEVVGRALSTFSLHAPEASGAM